MRTNTLVMLLIAIVFGSIAVGLANVWLDSQSRLAAVAPTPQEPVETSTIVVASTNLAFGTTLKPETLREIPWPKNALPDGAFATIAEISAEGSRVVLSPVGPNEPILKWKISGPDARASLSALVSKGMRAVAIRVNDVVGVAGFILPGDRVDVLYTRAGGSEGSSTDILIQNARILAVDQLADEKNSQPSVAKVVTIEVNTTDAQKIALAQTTGALSLTLRSAGSLDQAPAQRVVEQELTSSPSVYEAKQAALNERLAGLESTFAILGKSIEAGDSDKADLVAKLADIEGKLRDEIANAGNDDPELKAKLAALQAAIRQMAQATGQSEESLRARLAEFEAALRRMAETPADDGGEELPEMAAEKITATVGVTRGTERKSYEVPLESAGE